MRKTAMMKKNRIIVFALIAMIILAFTHNIKDRFSYSEELPFYSVPIDRERDTTLTIGIIGDSWVSGGILDSIVHYGLLKQGFENKIISSGHPGARTKLIYQNLFKGKENEFSSKFIIENSPDYCIVVAGVNDALSQIGGHFYSYHMRLIIKTLLHYKIKPIIVSCPEFGVKETIDNMNVLKKNRNIISAYFNNNGEINNIKTYRQILAKELDADNMKDSIIFIDFENVCNDYRNCPELYENSSHLLKKGNEILCQIIIDELIGKINTRGIVADSKYMFQ